ncbi:MAG: substrate-binding domain-containing protein [Candidatus Schekmanbacteria bacterium]|nr:substrate-binding domain-containing protein [Candidatus Schekmanbacteria bacterium]
MVALPYGLRLRAPLFLALAVFLLGSTPALSPAQALRLNGATTVQKRIVEPNQAALQTALGVSLSVAGNGTGPGLIDLLEGRADVAMASESLEMAVESAKAVAAKKGTTLPDTSDLRAHPLVEDVIVPIVHKANPVAALSFEQLAGLCTGKITDWKEVGGEALPVAVVTAQVGEATRHAFQVLVMAGADYAAGARAVSTVREEVDLIAKLKGAIGAVSESFVDASRVKAVRTDKISRPLILVTRGEPTEKIKELVDFLISKAGK